jgi:hypothetical protein
MEWLGLHTHSSPALDRAVEAEAEGDDGRGDDPWRLQQSYRKSMRAQSIRQRLRASSGPASAGGGRKRYAWMRMDHLSSRASLLIYAGSCFLHSQLSRLLFRLINACGPGPSEVSEVSINRSSSNPSPGQPPPRPAEVTRRGSYMERPDGSLRSSSGSRELVRR